MECINKKIGMKKEISFSEKKTVTVAAPGTVANLVCGFDVLGLCLNAPADEMTVTLINEKEVRIKSADGYNLPTDPMQNTAGAPLIEMLQ
jgi:homoserine kinase